MAEPREWHARTDDRPGRDDSLLCFIHINKNGGSTIRRILQGNYSPRALLEGMVQGRRGVSGRAKTVDGLDEDVHQIVTEAQNRQHELECIVANLPFGVHRYLDRPVAYLAFVREPVSRCISYWYFAYRNRASGGLWSTLEAYDFDVRRVVADHAAYQFSNDQLRMITGSAVAEVGARELELAREIIEHRYLLVGTTESLDASVRKLSRACGWRSEPTVRLNERAESGLPALPRNAERWFQEANEWDRRLHDWLLKDYLPRNL